MRQLANGSRLLVERSGGLRVLWELGRRPELETLVRCEWLASMVNADEPGYLNDCTRPQSVPALADAAQYLTLHASVLRSCGPDAEFVAKDLQVLLYYRCSPEQTHTCPTLTAFHYLTDLLNHVDMQLCALQRQYLGTATVMECFVLGLILLRIEVFEDGAIFPQLGKAIYNRFYQAMLTTPLDEWIGIDEATLLRMWLLCIGSLVVRDVSKRSLLRSELGATLTRVLSLSVNSQNRLLDALYILQNIPEGFMWHGRLQRPFKQLRRSLMHSHDGSFAFAASFEDYTTVVDQEPHMDSPV